MRSLFVCMYVFFFFFEIVSPYVVQAVLEPTL